MRDRTIILLALLFLVFSVGVGVDRSLAAGNKMLGRQMAPDFEQIYRKQAPLVLTGAKEITQRIEAGVTYWRGKLSSHLTQKMIY